MTEELISFVVPAYNEEALIASCLQAIVAETARTGHPAEIIVVNNNSTDRTREIACPSPASPSSMSRNAGWCRRGGRDALPPRVG